MNKIKCIKTKYGDIIPIHHITWIGILFAEPAVKVGDQRHYVTPETYNKLIEELEIIADKKR